MKRAQQAMAEARARQPHLSEPRVHVFAIEKHRDRYNALRSALEPFQSTSPGLIHPLYGELSDHLDAIRRQIGSAPVFYFLDPFGISGLEASTYPKALEGAHNEIFALFADIGAVRLHGLVTAKHADPAERIASILNTPSLFPDDDAAAIEAAEHSAMRANEAIDASSPASREHLTRALGGEKWESLADVRSGERADAFLSLFVKALLGAGARTVLTMPMRNEKGRRVYALVHASKAVAALMTMKEAVSAGLGRQDIAEATRAAVRADLRVDIDEMLHRLRRAFAGETLLWAAPRSGVRDLVLANTELFGFQMEELKDALKQAGILQRVNRKEVCVFPSVTPENA